MKGKQDSSMSRRRWLGQVSAPLAAASVGALVPGAKAADGSAGARVYDVRAFGPSARAGRSSASAAARRRTSRSRTA